MKTLIKGFASLFVLGAMVASCSSGASTSKVNLKSAADSAAYAHGVLAGSQMATGLKNLPGEEQNPDILLRALAQAIKDTNLQMTPEEASNFLNEYYPRVMEQLKQKNLEEGEKFLAENKIKEGVVTTESGLQYKVETLGEGIKATSLNDTIVVHYKGTLLDGTEFDSSYERGEPAEFTLNYIIEGWKEGFMLVPAGSKFTLWIPSNLAYGEMGAGGVIGPNATLQFECELLEVKPAPAEASAE